MADKLNIPGFKHYELDSTYQAKLAAGEVDAKDLSFVKETGKIHTQGGEYGGGVKWSYLRKVYNVGDIVYHDGLKLKTVNSANWNENLGAAIGVVVIPNNFLPDGKARVVSVFNGASKSWGMDGTDSLLTNHTRIPKTSNVLDDVITSVNAGFLPTDDDNHELYEQSITDPLSYYPYDVEKIPSPYKGAELNPDYVISLDGYINALSDFRGDQNTRTLTEVSDKYAAANEAALYKDSAEALKWYMPAMGELGFIMPRLKVINTSLGVIGGDILRNLINSSTEVSASAVAMLSVIEGKCVLNGEKWAGYPVRPFAIID